MEQLERAIQITTDRITKLEQELKRERDFLGRLLPTDANPVKRQSHKSNWLQVLQALKLKPMRHEHLIDFVEDKGFPMSRGATRVWLTDRVKRGLLKRDKDHFYHVSTQGQEFIKKSLA